MLLAWILALTYFQVFMEADTRAQNHQLFVSQAVAFLKRKFLHIHVIKEISTPPTPPGRWKSWLPLLGVQGYLFLENY